MAKLDQREFYFNIGQRIKSIRNNLGLNQEDFGTLFDLTRFSIVNIEQGKQRPSLFLLYEIAYKADISITEFVTDLLPQDKKQLELGLVKKIGNKEGLHSDSLDKITDFINKELF